jgi:hypothetical protein
MRACILFLTYDRFEYTKQSLQSIVDNTDRSQYDLLLWDNNSTEEGMLDWLEEFCNKHKFHFIFNKENAGLTYAMNNQMKIMNLNYGPYDVFCHIANDVVVPQNWLNGIFTAINHEEVGLIGLNLEDNSKFPLQDFGDIKLEKLRPECNVGGMHFCIPKRVYDLIGGFKDVICGYGQQDANYSLIVKLLPNKWWIYYLDINQYKGTHLGLLNFIPRNENNDKDILYKEYHDKMVIRLKASGNDRNGGKLYRQYIEKVRYEFDKKKITYEQMVELLKIPENTFTRVHMTNIKKTNLK